MDFKVNEEDVQKALMESIVKSSLGKALTDAVTEAISGSGYNNPVKDALNEHVRSTVKKIIEEDYATQIREAVVAKLSDEVTTEIIENAAKGAVNQITSNY